MGIFPVHCPVCDGYYHPSGPTHCQALEYDIENTENRLRKKIELLDAIILAYRANGDCKQEILNAAFDSGHSISNKEFKWLDEEMEKYKKEKK